MRAGGAARRLPALVVLIAARLVTAENRAVYYPSIFTIFIDTNIPNPGWGDSDFVPAFKVHNEFILPSEKEGFIHRLGDIIKRAESLMAKGHPSGHRLAQPAFHGGANSLSSSQVGDATPQR